MMRQIAGAFAEYEKARLVHKLRHARERKRQEGGKCEGRKSHKELRPEVVQEAKRLRTCKPIRPANVEACERSVKNWQAGLPQRARQALQSAQHQSHVGGVAMRQTSFLPDVAPPTTRELIDKLARSNATPEQEYC